MGRDASTSVLSVVFACAMAGASPAAPAGETKVEEPAAAEKSEARQCYDKIVDDYMHSKWVSLEASLKAWGKHKKELTDKQRADIIYIRKAYKEHRPKWWKKTHSSGNVTFTATIWGKSFKANYMPSEILGMQAPVGIEGGRLVVIVTWQPHMVDSPKRIGSGPPKAHKMAEGDFAEAIVWHELGHNYVSTSLPLRHILALYENYRMLFSNLQEFYADVTTLYHCSPSGRKAAMMLRGPGLSMADLNDPHTRGGHAAGALILAHVLADPAKWPSFRLPGRVPKEDPERKAIVYMYAHLDPNYTLGEDRALREVVGTYMRRSGAAILRKKGTLPLPNGLKLQIMTADDRRNQAERDLWVKGKLAAAIKGGLTDKPELYDEQRERDSFRARLFEFIVGNGTGFPRRTGEPGPTTRRKPKPKPTTKPAPKPAPKPTTKPAPKPAPKPKPKPAPVAKRDSAEQKANKELQKAENFLRNNMKSLAKKYLQKILRDYPKTESAKRADELIMKHKLYD